MSSALARFGSRRTDELVVLLERSARELAETLETLERIVHAHPHEGELLGDIRRSESAIRQTTRDLLGQLRERFVVPAEPADLRMLATSLEALATDAAQIAGRMTIFRLPTTREHARRVSHALAEAGAAARLGVARLAAGDDAADQAEELRGHARTADELIGEGLAELFAEAPGAAILVGWSDVYEHFTAMLPRLSMIAETLDAIRPPSR